MRQVLFHIPIFISDDLPNGIPIYGYGMMLFLAFVACTIVASWKAQREGIAKERLQDLALWLFIFGIAGARITFMIQYQEQFDNPMAQFFKIWDGGLVFYGSFIGGAIGYVFAYYFVFRKYQISSWKLADIVAPCVALGLCLGRLGCFLNGCCYGNVACADCPAVHFPLSSPARHALVERGVQTAAGFVMTENDEEARVALVEPGSPADKAGLKPGDLIIKADDQEINSYYDIDRKQQDTLWAYLVRNWPRGKTDLTLQVRRQAEDEGGETEKLTIKTFDPAALGLHPTQLYESISMLLLVLFLSAYYPFKKRDGQVMVAFMACYAVHRFLNEILRKDTDPVAFGMTLSQNLSVALLLAAGVLAFFVWRRPVQYPSGFGVGIVSTATATKN